jgi:hypothetical protein
MLTIAHMQTHHKYFALAVRKVPHLLPQPVVVDPRSVVIVEGFFKSIEVRRFGLGLERRLEDRFCSGRAAECQLYVLLRPRDFDLENQEWAA